MSTLVRFDDIQVGAKWRSTSRTLTHQTTECEA